MITESQIKELPLNGRSFDQLLTLNVGMIDNRSNINNGAWTSFSVSGKRPETNRFLMNGVDYIGSNSTGQFITPSGSSGQLLGVEAVREYNVLQNSYGAEYGKRAGAQVTVVSSSGTNQWHADLFEYLRGVPRSWFRQHRSPQTWCFNLTHQFNANFLYPLPIGSGHRFGGGASGLMDKLIGGWQWSGAFTAQSGFPFTPPVGSNASGTGDTQNPDVPNWNPDFKGPVILGSA